MDPSEEVLRIRKPLVTQAPCYGVFLSNSLGQLSFLFCYLLFSCYLFLDPPRGYVKTKKVHHTLSKSSPQKSPGTSPNQQSGSVFHMMPSSRFHYPSSTLSEKC